MGMEAFLSWPDYVYEISWWRHQMEILSALLVICAGNSPVPGELPAQRPVTLSFDVFFDLCPNKQLSKQWRGWWFETPSCLLWRHCNVDCTHMRDTHWAIGCNNPWFRGGYMYICVEWPTFDSSPAACGACKHKQVCDDWVIDTYFPYSPNEYTIIGLYKHWEDLNLQWEWYDNLAWNWAQQKLSKAPTRCG